MFIHRNRGRNAQAVSLGLLAAALISTGVTAADKPDAFVLVAYSNRAGGTQIANGEYLSATRVTRAGVLGDPGALATNHCVAFAMSEQLAQARLACDSAVEAATVGSIKSSSTNADSRMAFSVGASAARAASRAADRLPRTRASRTIVAAACPAMSRAVARAGAPGWNARAARTVGTG